MSRSARMPLPVLLALTAGPALIIGMTLWFVNSLVPECTVTEQERLTAPSGEFDLVANVELFTFLDTTIRADSLV